MHETLSAYDPTNQQAEPSEESADAVSVEPVAQKPTDEPKPGAVIIHIGPPPTPGTGAVAQGPVGLGFFTD